MDLSEGGRIGPYEIITRLGVGGMSEVYQARDTRLGRLVALKLLNQQIAPKRAGGSASSPRRERSPR